MKSRFTYQAILLCAGVVPGFQDPDCALWVPALCHSEPGPVFWDGRTYRQTNNQTSFPCSTRLFLYATCEEGALFPLLLVLRTAKSKAGLVIYQDLILPLILIFIPNLFSAGRLHLDIGSFFARLHFGCDSPEILLSSFLHLLLRESLFVISLDWNLPCLWWDHHFPGCGQRDKNTLWE